MKYLFNSIPRGVIYHSLAYDLKNIFRVIFANLKQEKLVEEYKKSFAKINGSKYCTIFSYARTGIHFSLKSQNFDEGTEVIMPPITIKAILDGVLDLGLKPIFVDIDSESFCFDIEKLKSSISPNTKAILITYLFGVVPNMDELIRFCKDNNLFVVEDFSQCLNGEYNEKKVGNFGDVGIYSSSTTKTLDTYGGGVCVTNREDIFLALEKYQKALHNTSRFRIFKAVVIDFIRNFATNNLVFTLITYPLIKLLDKLSNKSITKYVGDRSKKQINELPSFWFEKFSSFQARIGLELINSVEKKDKIRIDNVNLILNGLKTSFSKTPLKLNNSKNVYWQFVIQYPKPQEAINFFKKRGIDSATTSLIQISNLDYVPKRETINADKLLNNGVFIPSYSRLSNRRVNRIKKAVEAYERFI